MLVELYIKIKLLDIIGCNIIKNTNYVIRVVFAKVVDVKRMFFQALSRASIEGKRF